MGKKKKKINIDLQHATHNDQTMVRGAHHFVSLRSVFYVVMSVTISA